MNIKELLNKEIPCSCGRTHYVPIRAVEIGKGALEKVPHYVREFGYAHPYILCDGITYRIAGNAVEKHLEAAGISCVPHILTHTLFDEATLGEIVVSVPEDCDLMIGVGTGSITDITRYSSYRLGLPCFTVATGAPMDGFAASIGIMNVGNLKKTMQAHCTEAIFGDTDILTGAPYRMTVAGFGDLIGKLTCLNDWRLANIITGEHICNEICTMVSDCVEDILSKADRVREKDPSVLGDVMNGLVLTGSAISLYGDSRPASGAEHHMSHYWESIKEQRGETAAMHGEQVATATVLVLMLAEELKNTAPDFDKAREFTRTFSYEDWEREIRRAYGSAAQEVIALEKKAGKNSVEKRLARIDSMEKHWDEIVAQLGTLMRGEDLQSLLSGIGCPCTPYECGIDKALLKDTFMYCKETRPRYTILQTVYDLGLMDELSDKVIARIFS